MYQAVPYSSDVFIFPSHKEGNEINFQNFVSFALETKTVVKVKLNNFKLLFYRPVPLKILND
jgi:hypothetical protein